MNEFKLFVELVAEMRATQKEYFVTRDTALLRKAKKLESLVDRAIIENRRNFGSDGSTQGIFNFPD